MEVGLFYPTSVPEVQFNQGILTRAFENGSFSFKTFTETDNSCCVPRFPLSVSCYEILDSQLLSLYVKVSVSEILERSESEISERSESGVAVGNFGKVEVGVGQFTYDSPTLH